MREIEAQHFVVNQRPFLRHVRAQNLAQRRVHQVRCGVIQTNTRTTRLIHISLDRIAHFQRARRQLAEVANCLTIFLRVAYGKRKARAFQFTFIANLTTGFRIEWGLIQYDNGFLTDTDRINRFTIHKQRGHFTVQFQMVVAFKFRGAIHANHRVIVRTETAGFTRTTTLLFHGGFKTGFIHFDIALTANVSRQINRETVGIVQTECCFAVQRIAGQFRQFFVQQRQATLERTGKLLFFGFQYLLNLSLLTLQFFARRSHDVNQWTHQFVEEGFFRAQHVAMTYRTTNDTTQDIATVFVRRNHAVGNLERTGTNVIRNHAQ